MARYPYKCPNGHTTEHVQPIGDPVPERVECLASVEATSGIAFVADVDGEQFVACGELAERVWEPPAAVHFKGRGFYATDVKGAQQRRRRPNPGDRLERPHDQAAADIARSL